jgi:hypothetical protein
MRLECVNSLQLGLLPWRTMEAVTGAIMHSVDEKRNQ